jgi:hypothetical protein
MTACIAQPIYLHEVLNRDLENNDPFAVPTRRGNVQYIVTDQNGSQLRQLTNHRSVELYVLFTAVPEMVDSKSTSQKDPDQQSAQRERELCI